MMANYEYILGCRDEKCIRLTQCFREISYYRHILAQGFNKAVRLSESPFKTGRKIAKGLFVCIGLEWYVLPLLLSEGSRSESKP